MHLQDTVSKTTAAVDDPAVKSAEQPSQQFVVGASDGQMTLQSVGRTIFGKGNVLLACLFAAGIGCVYLLRLSGGPQTASAQQQINESQVNAVLTAIGAAGAKDTSASSVVAAFYTQASQRQLPLESLSANPFIYRAPEAKAMLPQATQPAISEAASAKNTALALETQMQAAKTLTLQSVLTGTAGTTAVISNNLLTEGQTIRGWTISKILSKEVQLTWKEQTFVLKMR